MNLEIVTSEQFLWFWSIFVFAGAMIIVGSVSTLRWSVRLEMRARGTITYRRRRHRSRRMADGSPGAPVNPLRPGAGHLSAAAFPTRNSPSAPSSEPLRRQPGPRDWSPRGGDR